jgi:hypothetical protein
MCELKGEKTWRRSEGNWWEGVCLHIPAPSAESWDLSFGLSRSTSVKTRKAVIYTCVGSSQRKLWWKLVSLLTCKSFVKHGYRGARLIEQLSSGC